MTFGKKLQNARRRAGLSQEDVAEMFDYSQSAISQWEAGQKTPRPAIQEWILQRIQEGNDAKS